MRQSRRLHLLAGAAAMTLTIMGWNTPAHAQYRIGESGHANDSNNRIGSGGYNGDRVNYPNEYGNASNIINSQVNGQIITGNVNGLNYFHGRVSEFDPNVVQNGIVSRSTDRFLAISQPSDIDARTTGNSTITPFYTTDKLAVVPQNFAPTANGVAVVPSNTVNNSIPSDTRLGVVNSPSSNMFLPTPGELDLPGPVDPSGNASSLIASPLYGMREFNPSDAGDAYFLSRYSNVLPNGPAQAARANDAQLQQMRAELNSTLVKNSNDVSANGNNPTGITPANANLAQSPQLNSSGALTNSTALPNQALTSGVKDQALSANPNTAYGTRQQLTGATLIPADQQSAQLRDLVQRLQSKQAMTPEQASQTFNEVNRLNTQEKQAAEEKAKLTEPGAAPTTPTPGGAGATPPATPGALPPDLLVSPPSSPGGPTVKPDNTTATPMTPMLTAPAAGGNDKPYIITSLAAGIKAQGLANLLSTAENQMRDGKFSTALDTYDSAMQVAPNNPFTVLGRAFAELGGETYGRAEADLRQSFTMESGVVLVGQYDLRGFLGEDRLKLIVKDLRDINAKERNESSAFLLAYIAHNVGDNDAAARLLDDAESRVGGNDPIISLMRDNWQLKKGGAK